MGLHGFHLDALMVKKVVRRAEVPVDGPDELLFCFGVAMLHCVEPWHRTNSPGTP